MVGSYPQPDWLVDHEKLVGRCAARIRVRDVWRVAEPYLEEAQDDATIVAIRDLERAGIDIVTDGEMRRESYSNHFATALDGVDIDNPATRLSRSGRPGPRAQDRRADPAPPARSRCATSSSCAPTPTAPSRSPCPARSR